MPRHFEEIKEQCLITCNATSFVHQLPRLFSDSTAGIAQVFGHIIRIHPEENMNVDLGI